MDRGDKLLKLNLCFKLPADFDGDLNDAIEALLKYRRGEKNHTKDFKSNPNADVYENWWNMVNTTDRVLYGSVSLSEYTGESSDNAWTGIKIKP